MTLIPYTDQEYVAIFRAAADEVRETQRLVRALQFSRMMDDTKRNEEVARLDGLIAGLESAATNLAVSEHNRAITDGARGG